MRSPPVRNKISELRAEGIEIYLAEVDANVKALIDQLSFPEVITDDGGHYRGIGNLLVALSIYDALGYDVNSSDLSTILEISDQNKELSLAIINVRFR